MLGVEGGGTKTAWVLVESVAGEPTPEFRILDQGKLPPSNLRLTTPERLRQIFTELPGFGQKRESSLAVTVSLGWRQRLIVEMAS